MPLLTLKTDFKSLKYGADRPGGGSSGQPYIVNDINNPTNVLGFDDGLVRGGVEGAVQSAYLDTKRIGKFILDHPLFLVKQVGLQLTNPRLEVPKDPANILMGGVDNVLAKGTNGLLEPTRIYNLGINTLAQVPVGELGIHINRHGLLPVQTDASKYEAVVTANNTNNNRLVGLKSKFGVGDIGSRGNETPGSPFSSGILGLFSKVVGLNLNINDDNLIVDEYLAGPGSPYGIGNTIINRFTFTENADKINKAFNYSSVATPLNITYHTEPRLKNGSLFGVSNHSSSSLSGNPFLDGYIISDISDSSPTTLNGKIAKSSDTGSYVRDMINLPEIDNIHDLSLAGPSFNYPGIDTDSFKNRLDVPHIVYGSYSKVNDDVNALRSPNNLGIYASIVNHNNINGERLPTSTTKYPTYTNSYGTTYKTNISWDKATRENRIGSGRRDSINLTPIFSGNAGNWTDVAPLTIPNTDVQTIRDLVKFRIQAIDTDNPTKADWMIFRAYITDLSDGVDAEWTDIKYAGRGDKFHIYNGFSRKMSVSFKVAALSKYEMEPMYQKLNFLMSNLMPDYSNNVMRGPMMRMTIGNWIDGQLCILNSLSYKIPQESPWEIALDEPEAGSDLKMLILPHIVEVSLNFTPIGSQTLAKNKISEKSQKTSHIAQNWNDYQFIK